MKRVGIVFPALLVFRRLYLSEAEFTGLFSLLFSFVLVFHIL